MPAVYRGSCEMAHTLVRRQTDAGSIGVGSDTGGCVYDLDMWKKRWKTGDTGWHKTAPNPMLVEHVPESWSRVLVPLCGASLDLGWMVDEEMEVVGVEISEIAARRVFEYRGVEPTEDRVGPYTRLQHEGLTVLIGDFFDITPEVATGFDGVWDRIALVAIPDRGRAGYLELVKSMAPDAVLLLDTFDYAPGTIPGLPDPAPDALVKRLLPNAEMLVESDEGPRDKPGIFVERLYRIVPE